jgi:hypothetical protein
MMPKIMFGYYGRFLDPLMKQYAYRTTNIPKALWSRASKSEADKKIWHRDASQDL